jgi:hypothetical protein
VKDGFNKDSNGEKKVVRVHVSSIGRRRSMSSRRKKRDERRIVKMVCKRPSVNNSDSQKLTK